MYISFLGETVAADGTDMDLGPTGCGCRDDRQTSLIENVCIITQSVTKKIHVLDNGA